MSHPETAPSLAASDINFLMVGGQRCGSTWVYKALKDHPDIHLPPQKQTYFFDSNYERGMDWYLDQFGPKKKDAKVVGEIATSYCLPDIFPRVARELPHIKVILTVRNPVDRALSYFNSRRDMKGWRSIEEAIAEEPEILTRGLYMEQIETILKFVPRDRLLLLFYDDLVKDDRSYLRSLLTFLDVDPDFESPAFGQRIQVSAFRRARKAARAMGLGRLLDTISRSRLGDWIRRFLARHPKQQAAAPHQVSPLAQALAPHFTDGNLALARFSGRSLDHWNHHVD